MEAAGVEDDLGTVVSGNLVKNYHNIAKKNSLWTVKGMKGRAPIDGDGAHRQQNGWRKGLPNGPRSPRISVSVSLSGAGRPRYSS